MRRVTRQLLAGLAGLSLVLGVMAGPLQAGSSDKVKDTTTYDLIFKEGTLDGLDRNVMLTYSKQAEAKGRPDIGEKTSGTIRLAFAPDNMAELRFASKGEESGRFRTLAEFPASVGNPLILYFVETVVRDMAATAGGSPYYIRNRVKASLLETVPVETASQSYQGKDIDVQKLTLRPFKSDPNRDRMQGFADLALTVTVSKDVPGWYLDLSATAPATGGEEPVYSMVLHLEGEGVSDTPVKQEATQ
ncbi:hypothetical protein [Roseibium litorale]|uniref:Uncharacterized protein n=1 Tax=Roseibium litorale TaxID=2803841 RepID=A0ABR9CK57_9HYPH|nr:hypothetical protein [Roseibium litorale]MBD8891039.1 hypothetical protein [Roseibium litorale]